MTARRLVLLIVLLLFGWPGCRRTPPELPPAVPIETSLVESTLRELHREAESVRRYQGFVRIRGKGPEGGFDARLVVVFERPHRLRVDLLGAFGATRWSAVANEDGIRVLFPGPRQFVEEEDTADIVGRLLGIRLESGEVMDLLAGAGMDLGSQPSRAERRGVVTFVELAGARRVELDEDGRVASAATPTYRVEYPSSWNTRGRQIPDRLRLENGVLQATIVAEDVDVNVALDPEAFDLQVPTGAERLRPSDVAGEAVFVVTQEKR